MTNLLAPMDDRLSDHLQRVRTKRVVLVTICHLPLMIILSMELWGASPSRWSLIVSILLIVITDILLIIDLVLDHAIF